MRARTIPIVFFLLLLLISNATWAQLSRGGTPVSFAKGLTGDIPTVTTGRVDVAQYQAQDKIDEAEGLPFRFGAPFDVDYDFAKMAAWYEFADGSRVGRMRIKSPGAFSINLIYSAYQVPEGARFFVYGADRKMVIGAFDHRNNKEHGQFATQPVKGDDIILEYFEPADVTGQGSIVISRIVHGYLDIFSWDVASQALGFGGSGSCNNNVNCPEGDPWQDEKRGVVMILLSSGTRWCSGSLINNTRQDQTPYLLTANHCLGGQATWIFMFNYESPTCANVDGPTNMTVQGSTLLANNSTSDFALVLLDEPPPDSYYVYYNGWVREDNPSTRSTGIHHPSGDIKKISFDYDPVTSTNYLSTTGTTHWRVGNWEDGTTEGGSSGSPLFDQNHRIVGQLHGGYASCTSITADWYGKLYTSWSGGGSSSNRLSNWLDPDVTGAMVLDGYDPFAGVSITHTPLEDTRDTVNSYMVIAAIVSTYDLVSDSLLLVYEVDAVIDSLTMTYTGLNADYRAYIPVQSPGSDISYYVFAKDIEGNTDTTDIFTFSIIDYGLQMFADADTIAVGAYDTAWFDLTIVNTGQYDDGYQLDLSGETWTATVFDASGTVPMTNSGVMTLWDSLQFKVAVEVPLAAYGTSDTVTLTATSAGDPSEIVTQDLASYSVGMMGGFPWGDEFPDASVDSIQWIYNSQAEISDLSLNPPTPPYVLNLDGGYDTLVSQPIDLTGKLATKLSFAYQRGGPAALPGDGDNLVFDYLTNIGGWTNLIILPGGGAAMTEFEIQMAHLPSNAIHDQFQLRLRSIGGGEGTDDWFIDDIIVDFGATISVTPDSIHQVLSQGDSAFADVIIANNGLGQLTYTASALPGITMNLFTQLTDDGHVEAAQREHPIEALSQSLTKGQEIPALGTSTLYDAGGPDDFGNYWIDSDEPGGPIFGWEDISGSGTDIIGLMDDDNYAGPYELGFDFPFYGSNYQQIYIGSNGIIGFAAEDMGLRVRTSLPTATTPNNIIAWLWDDLDPTDLNNTDAHVYLDTTDDRFVISFVDYPEYSAAAGDVITAQVILEQTGHIKLQYLSVAPGFDVSFGTVGIENAAATDGLEIAFASPYLHDSLAVEIFQPHEWLSVAERSGHVLPGESDTLSIKMSSGDLDEGSYSAWLVIESNDPDTLHNPWSVPVTLTVSGSATYVCGDADGNGSGPDIADLVYLVNYMFNGGPPPLVLEATDVNGDLLGPDIGDLVYLVAFMFSSGPALNCPGS